jgi:Zn-finger in ubiquitin-hydrolases and other protein
MDGASRAGLKALYSDARKRAAVAAGIGAYLYTALEPVVLPIGSNDRQVQLIRRSGKPDMLALSPGTEQLLRHGYQQRMDTITVRQLPDSVAGCENCMREGGVWLHLRICLECGHVGCCDDSPNRHATAHRHSSGHPLIRSLEPGEESSWCYVDEVGMLIPDVRGETRIPPSPMLTG